MVCIDAIKLQGMSVLIRTDHKELKFERILEDFETSGIIQKEITIYYPQKDGIIEKNK